MAEALKIAVSNEVKIDKGIPMIGSSRGGRPSRYPWLEMEVGDSFLFPSDVSKANAYSAPHKASKVYAPRKFAGRTTPDGMRVWRIA